MNLPGPIYHVTEPALWQAAQATGLYTVASLHSEGFIHCSTQAQVAGVLERYYKNRQGLSGWRSIRRCSKQNCVTNCRPL